MLLVHGWLLLRFPYFFYTRNTITIDNSGQAKANTGMKKIL